MANSKPHSLSLVRSEGRRCGLSTEQIADILKHRFWQQPDMTQASFCAQAGIHKSRYWRVINLKYKKDSDKEKVRVVARILGIDLQEPNK